MYGALRVEDGREVAIKVARRSGDPRFEVEATALRRLGAPLTPDLLAHGRTRSDHPYLVMERLHGVSLACWIAEAEGGAPALEERVKVLCQLARILEAVHGAGVVHRDLKPANVVLRPGAGSPRPVLLDFGLARILDPGPPAGEPSPEFGLDPREITKEGARLGTLVYMSPEQCRGQQADARADIYGLGVLLFEILTGRPPFEGDAAALVQAHASRRPPRPSQIAPVPPALDAVVLRCLAKRPEDRFQRAGEVARALSDAIAHAAAEPLSEAPRRSAERPSRSRREVALLALSSSAPLDRIAEAARREGGQVARIAHHRCVLAFPEASPGAGVRAALRVAVRLADVAEDPVVHVATLVVREGPRGFLLMGSILDQVESWAPRQGSQQPHLTEAAAAAIQLLASSSSELEATASRTASDEAAPPSVAPSSRISRGARALIDDLDFSAEDGAQGPPAVRGREALLSALRAEAERCIEDHRPALSVVVGEVGQGKTRLLEAIAAELSPRFGTVLEVRAPSPERGDPEALLRALLRLAFDLADRSSAEAVREACRSRLDAAEGEVVWPAVALALAAIVEGDAAVAPLSTTPGGLRRAAARAAADALRARAAGGAIAILVDDAQWADPASLDALELAALEGGSGALWICIAALPALRPQWGRRAARRALHELAPLDEDAMRALLRDLLRPVEFVSEEVLQRLLQVTGGVPLYAVEVAHALRTGGEIRRRPGTGDWYIASDDLLRASSTPLAERLAARASAGLPPALLGLLRLCCVVGDEIDAAELARIQAELEALGPAAAGEEAAAVDAPAGLERLAQLGVLEAVGKDRYRFRHPIVRDAHAQLMPAVARRTYHDAARRYLAERAATSEAALARLANHAAGCGEHAQAAHAYLELAASAARHHRYIEAEQRYTSALLVLPAGDAGGLERALAGRGRVRTYLERHADALQDLRKAQALARARDDEPLVASLLLDEATLLDFCEDHAASGEAAAQAAPLVERLGDRALSARLAAARGRTHWRYERTREAIDGLSRAAELAAALGDARTRVESLLMLAPALVAEGRLIEAEQRFEEVVALCEQVGDRVHLGAAYINRIVIWIKRQDHERAAEDQRRALAIARELGHADMERYATYNLAELLYFRGAYEEAEPLARRSRELQLRLHARPTPDDTLLLSRIEGALGRTDAARELLDWVCEQCPDEMARPSVRAIVRCAELLCRDPEADSPAEWDALIEQTRGCALLDELLDVAYHAAARAVAAARWGEASRRIIEAAAEAGDNPLWQGRLAALRERLPAPGDPGAPPAPTPRGR